MADEGKSNSGDADLEKLLSRVENLKEEQKEIAEQIKDVKAEAKSLGYDMKAFSAILSLRAKDAETREAIGLYADRLGVFG
jgi:uncharacterized protein (UPF0335 family)